MKEDLENLDWMDPTTRMKALEKLSLVSNMIGAPTNPKNYSVHIF
jgi:predicted metalloendopeptidase